MASGPVRRTDRPNTWLLRPALRRAQSLDSPEPSTHGPMQTSAPRFGEFCAQSLERVSRSQLRSLADREGC